ncbi:MAG: FapA family protein [bacterium]|nr:FapA family protein [bacterium]
MADHHSPANLAKRMPLGQKGWINIEISHDGRRAFLKEVSFGGDASLGADDIFEVLAKKYRILAGVKDDVVNQVAKQAARSPHEKFATKKSVVIAEETPPVLPQDGQIHFTFLDEVEEGIQLPYRGLGEAFQHRKPDSILGQNLRVRAVCPDEEIAVLTGAVWGELGRDIYGRTTSLLSNPRHVTLEAGAHVTVVENRFTSRIFGYVRVEKGVISVVPPIAISEDEFEAYFIHFSQVSPARFPKVEWLEQLLSLEQLRQKVTEETEEALEKYIRDHPNGKGKFAIAQGTPPTPGDDAHLECSFDQDVHIGLTLPDGTPDLDTRRSAIGVEKGQMIAESKPPQMGIPGISLRGEELPAQDGGMRTFQAGENVTVEYDEDGHPKFYFAKIDGNGIYDGQTVDVRTVLRIGGDVDAAVGNIDTDQDVEIAGSVKAGLRVNAKGSVTIGGVVEKGAVVASKDDVVVAQGILGSDTKVMALGNVQTKFVQESAVMARRSIYIGDHIFKGHIRCGEELVVESGNGPRSGSIIGGSVIATTGLQAEVIGSPSSHQTQVGIGQDLDVEVRMKKVDGRLDFCNSNILRMFRSLNIQNLDRSVIEVLIRRTPPGRKKSITRLLKNLQDLVGYRDENRKQKKILEVQRDQILRKAEIKVSGTIYADTQICIDNDALQIAQDMGQTTFFQSADGISWRTWHVST